MRTVLPIVLLWPVATGAGMPVGTFPDCGPDNPGACPNDLGSWDEISWIPASSQASVRPAEQALGSGIAMDVAFRHSTGRWDVRLAILDSGIEWQQAALANKIWLNAGELPQPLDADSQPIDGWDLDGNGLLNVADYAEDPRVDRAAGVDLADGILDPSDLIHTFSDGVDDDGNGYPDDIAGWDFFGGDNDAFAVLDSDFSGHGSGVMREAADSGDDGGGIGVCPNCAIVPVRVGDAFVTDGDRVGLGLAYAETVGVRAIGMAIGGLTHPRHVREAVAHAEDLGIVVVGAAGDENSYHHNFPAAEAPILYVHSIRGNTLQERDGGVYSFLNHWNCNNFGPRIDLVASSSGCATGAVAKTTGAAALLSSTADDLGLDLGAAALRALLRGSADDVWLSDAELAIAATYPSAEGWDAYYGYGRLNVGRAVEQLVDGDLPPIAHLTAPRWFTWAGNEVVVHGRVEGVADAVTRWVLEVGTGLEPGDWREIGRGNNAIDGELARFHPDPVPLPADLWLDHLLDRVERAHEGLVTVRLTVTDSLGRSSEDRRGVWAIDDPDLARVIDLGNSAEASPQLVDLDGDGVFEIVLATSDGRVHAFTGDGHELAGFPVATGPIPGLALAFAEAEPYASGAIEPPRQGVVATPAVGDIDGDGFHEIVVGTLWGEVYAWNTDGSVVDGFPVHVVGRAPEEMLPGRAWDQGIAAAPTLADLDGDGALEVIVAAMDQRLYVWGGDGTLRDGYPVVLCQPGRCDEVGARILSSPAIGDIDGDGDLDAALGTNEVPVAAAGLLYLVDLSSGTLFDGAPLPRKGLISRAILPIVGEGHPASPALADLNGDGRLELASNPMLSSHGPIEANGDELLQMKFAADGYGADNTFLGGSLITLVNNPAFGDLDGDGVPDFVTGGATPTYLVSLALASVLDYQHGMAAWSGATGEMFPGFPRQGDDVAFLSAPAIADISGDGVPEVIWSGGGFGVYAADHLGNVPVGWPKHTGGWAIGTPAVGDVDGDGLVEVVIATREGAMLVFDTAGRADQQVQWSSLHHDPANTSNWHLPLATQLGPVEQGGCCGGRRSKAGWVALLPLFLVRRRRR